MDPAPPEVAPEDAPGRRQEEEEGEADEERWSRLLPELLTDIVRRVYAGAKRWPPRRDVIGAPASAAAGVAPPSPSSALP
ncbi:tubby-like F-box protein 9 [Hordeum vulgare]|nr:tubby-like F-box protein 9 [Hordeum vulgare]